MDKTTQDDEFNVLCVEHQIMFGRMDPPITMAGKTGIFCGRKIPSRQGWQQESGKKKEGWERKGKVKGDEVDSKALDIKAIYVS
jgi:hypothetical protein